jgi:hypothetical protein
MGQNEVDRRRKPAATKLNIHDLFNIICICNLVYWFYASSKKGGRRDMATVKKAKCAAKTKEGKACKNSASGKSKFCASHKKK